jgi:hypothetical protein
MDLASRCIDVRGLPTRPSPYTLVRFSSRRSECGDSGVEVSTALTRRPDTNHCHRVSRRSLPPPTRLSLHETRTGRFLTVVARPTTSHPSNQLARAATVKNRTRPSGLAVHSAPADFPSGKQSRHESRPASLSSRCSWVLPVAWLSILELEATPSVSGKPGRSPGPGEHAWGTSWSYGL